MYLKLHLYPRTHQAPVIYYKSVHDKSGAPYDENPYALHVL